MAFTFEFDDLRREVKRSEARTLQFWPKVSGRGNVAVSAASFIVRDRAGAELQTSTPATIVADGTISRLDLAMPSIPELGEDYRCDVTFTIDEVDGATVNGLFFFDVVLYPLLDSEPISLNDLQDHRSDIAKLLTRLGSPHTKTAEEMATLYGYRGYAQADSWIRAAGYRPHAILNRERVRRLVVFLALKVAYFSATDDPEGENDKLGKIYKHYAKEAQAAWQEMQPLKFSDPSSEELVVAEVVESVGSQVQARRVAPR